MVFFNCNGCGEALKKNQVEKHTYRCRHCQVLSCVDCGKDFWGNDYQSHTKCMTEEEKYCGPGYVSKVNKGEAKQEQWIEKVQSAIDKSTSNPGLKKLLIRLRDYPNIPRKQQKFQNFLRNSLRVYDTNLCGQVWDTLMAHSAQNDSKKEIAENNPEKEVTSVDENKNPDSGVDNTNGQASQESADLKKSKREKKEERRNKANKKEKKDKEELLENGEKQVKKTKKRKHRDSDSEEENVNKGNDADVAPQKKKKKKTFAHEEIDLELEVAVNGCDVKENSQPEPDKQKKRMKFNWEKTITQVLERKGEISLKKLRKKVLNEFAALDAANYCEENLLAKFDKKVKKLPNVQVLKDRARLKGT